MFLPPLLLPNFSNQKEWFNFSASTPNPCSTLCVWECRGESLVGSPLDQTKSTTSLVNSAKLGRQGTKILVLFLINYTICDPILVWMWHLVTNFNSGIRATCIINIDDSFYMWYKLHINVCVVVKFGHVLILWYCCWIIHVI